jgi:flavin reductase (DIM6/NTAB) family NADH-FMN oxidoreductase RutF
VDTYYFEPAAGHGLPHDPFNAIIGPRPIGWISSLGAEGRRNLAPYSFFNAFNYRPPIIGFSSTGWKHTVANIQATREFVWNLATKAQAEQMNATSATVPAEVDEFELAGLEGLPSRMVAPQRVAGSPVHFECRVAQIVQLQTADGDPVPSWLVLGEVVAVHIDSALLKDGIYQTALPHPILRAGGIGGYAEIRPDAMFDMPRPS